MRIGITQRVTINKHGVEVDSLEADYIKYYSRYGFVIPIPNTLKNPVQWLKNCGINRLILSGGGDVHPKLYGGKPQPGIHYQETRDATEARLLRYALKEDIPILAQCRGAEFVNVALKGALCDIKRELPNAINHDNVIHTVVFTEAVVPLLKKARINSFHRFGFTCRDLAPSVKVFAETKDGVVEGFIHRTKPLIGIMWHPERSGGDSTLNTWLISSFMNGALFKKHL